MFEKVKILLIILLASHIVCAQSNYFDTDSLNISKLPIIRPDLMPMHPLGSLSMRKMNNFKFEPGPGSFKVSLSNGNVWLPHTDIYYPKYQSAIDSLMLMPWHYRSPGEVEAEKEILKVDGLLRAINLQVELPLNAKHELAVKIRTLYLERGRKPFTFFNSDDFIEDFHSHVYGGEDPFARKVYGINKVDLYYQQTDGDVFEMGLHQFVIPGFEFSHYYYPDWQLLRAYNIHVNTGNHVGLNTTRFNNSLDYGVSFAVLKSFLHNDKKALNLSVGSTILYHQLLTFRHASHIYDNSVNWMAEGNLEYKWLTERKNKLHSIALDFYVQSSYKRGYRGKDANNEFHYNGVIFYGNRFTSHWHTTATQLMEPLQTWSFSYSYYLKEMVISIYLQEDLKVNNAPDTQTGISLTYFM